MVIILKIGGGKGVTDNLDNILKDVSTIDEKIIIVHGANHEMKEISQKLGNPEKIVKSPSGYSSRFTDEKTLEIFMMVYCGIANKRIVTKLQKLGIKKIGLFGSYLRGEQKKDSDIDLLVELNSSKFDFYMETKFYLEDLLKKRVDLVEIKALKKGVEYVKEEAKYVKGL